MTKDKTKSKAKETTNKSLDVKDYRHLKEFFINDKCLPIIEFFIENPEHFYTRAEILDKTTIDKGTLNRYLPVLSKSKYDILATKKYTFEGRRNNTTIYAINMTNECNVVIQQLLAEIKKLHDKHK